MDREETIIEGDSLSIIKKCNSVRPDKSLVGLYIQDIQRITTKARKLRFEFILRSENNLAHVLATESLRRREEVYLVNDVPIYAKGKARDESIREPD
ncbi:glycine, alanine and asparagine-rich protein-like [Gossypium australe]|uniref:Glycine, alanine and asparagine-rich protein-like n=1 Tax=Gossypium australe TaxID=47621 RepID=A0A5B6VPL9_9ROSI|nr:glycine, alanine and asparagine-rich protein-like [Gossypium australe]